MKQKAEMLSKWFNYGGAADGPSQPPPSTSAEPSVGFGQTSELSGFGESASAAAPAPADHTGGNGVDTSSYGGAEKSSEVEGEARGLDD